MTMEYGTALRVEGHNCLSASILGDAEAVKDLLVTTIKVAGMSLMAGPFVAEEPARDVGKGPGITACAILCESHAVIHTYPEQRWFLFEMTTCKEFDPERVINLLKTWAECQVVTDICPVGRWFPEPVETNG